MRSPELTREEEAALTALEPRLGLENDHEARVLRKGTHFFHLENWHSVHSLIRNSLRLVGLYGRGRRNALAIQVRENDQYDVAAAETGMYLQQ